MYAMSNGFLGLVVEEFDREIIWIFCQQRNHPPLGITMLVCFRADNHSRAPGGLAFSRRVFAGHIALTIRLI